MAPLLQRIANLLASRVTKAVTVEDLLRIPCGNCSSGTSERPSGYVNVLEAKLMLEEWKKSYLELRAFNDFSSQVPMWEFDRKRLFERTDHICGVCQNILEVFDVSRTFLILSKVVIHDMILDNFRAFKWQNYHVFLLFF